ncbi:MAG: c-type cytochrome biogenesis protein CcmF [Devosia sp. 67-54]|uniref:heme lyase CcmF/NrfE family subunit n=1 Tax=unclassified Devosia TaxID=196773 RepID=UPI00095956A6|nr:MULTISPECIES: heme lyase CcmF/NrfE family subunit [unclassified Devosia]MBN9305668.1 heme lyase CcmF/NrfE family subunit [Devosia sp.]OJX19232.1 MAG: c-type cytochrome biogenesis protein CcmF [Devosia sp. 67-54]
MNIELGHFALILATAIAAVSALAGFWGWRRSERITLILRQGAVLQFLLVAAAFVALIQAFVTSDFSLALAYEHSHSLQPLLFKVTSVWGNHEGSMVLWVMILVLMGAAVALFGRNLPRDLLTLVLSMQSLLAAAFGGFTLFTSNPFLRLSPAPLEGQELNPILQDIGLAIHPPLLYTGYVGFSICFSFAVAALISGRIDAAWARWVRPWALLSWCFLTLGIAMGSYWAYYELGWGGWWFWDPVENASFMPWLAGTALLHSALVMEKRNALKIWTIFLALITFSLSLLGTFMVRSGVLTSVHSFATDPTRGLVILALLALFIGGAFALFALRASALRVGGLFAPISREGALILNNLFLSTALVAVLVGTLYPLLLEATTGKTISVGAPFFSLTFGTVMAPLLIVLPFGPFLAWKRGDLVAVTQRLAWAAGLAVFVTVLIFALSGGQVSLAPLGLLLGFWAAFGAIAELVDRSGLGRMPLRTSWHRLVGLPRSAFSTALAHFGLGISVIGIVAASAWQLELITTMQPGASRTVGDYTLRFDGIDDVRVENYAAEVGKFTVTAGGDERHLTPERRVYTASGTPTTEAAIETYGFSQLYVQLGEQSADGSRTVRVWYKPYVTLIWLGAILMALAGGLSLTDRRLRVGVARRTALPKPAPAE